MRRLAAAVVLSTILGLLGIYVLPAAINAATHVLRNPLAAFDPHPAAPSSRESVLMAVLGIALMGLGAVHQRHARLAAGRMNSADGTRPQEPLSTEGAHVSAARWTKKQMRSPTAGGALHVATAGAIRRKLLLQLLTLARSVNVAGAR
jgi:hypothetical protein